MEGNLLFSLPSLDRANDNFHCPARVVAPLRAPVTS